MENAGPLSWGEFKAYVEAQGVTDDMGIDSIVTVYPSRRDLPTVEINKRPSGKWIDITDTWPPKERA